MSVDKSIGPSLPPHMEAMLNGRSESKNDEDDDVCGPSLPPEQDTYRAEMPFNKSAYGPMMPSKGNYTYGPSLPPKEVEEGDDEAYGPALPPGFKKSQVVGPAMPPSITASRSFTCDNEDDYVIGPLPPSSSQLSYNEMSSKQRVIADIEKRAKDMKEKIEGLNKPKKLEREQWMLELPSDKQDFGMGPRKFRKNAKNLGDRSVWTDTPADRERKAKEAQARRNEPVPVKPHEERDREWTKEMEKIKPQQQSLLEMHSSERKRKMKDERKKKKKDKKDKEEDERRPFDRDVDLQANRFDNARKQRIIKQSQELSSRFSHGNKVSKFL